ncbi:unnamed protein product [Ceutorhynchus assimilis]|uniref:C2 domain-containing protein n=1 Tax=Ceutorhynchus assimilis TaxID=467358 RepID=A0A9P0GQG3_9CUCU|nr:unnamed protein product [Ceutorhynchus assimilis]
MLENIARNLKFRLEEIKNVFLSKSLNIADKLSEASEYLLTSIETYLDILETSFVFDYGSALDQERIKQCKTSILEILNKLLILQNNKSKKVVYRNLEDFQGTIESLIEDVQPCWPDVYIWVTSINKKLGYLRIPARKIVFSPIEEAIGEDCGKVRPMLFLIEGKSDIICKIEGLLWIGLEKEKDKFLQMIPKGFKYEGKMLKAVESHIFESHAYIFGGSMDPGFDASGLADPFVQCCLGQEMKETLIKWSVCVPIWDETLFFHNLVFYGAKEHLKEYPPTFLVQMFDKDPIHSVTIELKEKKIAVPIPDHIKPLMEPYRIEVLFWGVRNLRKVHLIRINRPKIIFHFENSTITSQVIDNAKKFPNFTNNICSLDVIIPNQSEYPGMVWLKLFDSRKFGVYVYCGISLDETTPFLLKLMTKDERLALLTGLKTSSSVPTLRHNSIEEVEVESKEVEIELEMPSPKNEVPEKVKKPSRSWEFVKKCLRCVLGFKKVIEKSDEKSKSGYTLLVEEAVEKEEDESDHDWWTKFYASVEKGHDNQNLNSIQTLKIYPNELECQPEFNGFSDMLTTFEIFKGKQIGDEIVDDQFITAIVKGSIKFYKWPPEDEDIDQYVTPQGSLAKDGVFSNIPANTNLNYVLRIYCVRGINLRPKDLNGKSDPYIEIKLDDKLLNDRENYIPRDVNPTFGRCYEFNCSFPQTTSVTIRVKDYDMTSRDDLIGETKIDLENRFYTKHIASCGIPKCYRTKGYCKWRDQRKPSKILNKLCKIWGLEDPVYQENSISINFKEFFPKSLNPDPDINKEVLALKALRHWQEMPLVGFQIVPEHVETRSLFTPDKPGLEQGKLQLWIDIFPKLDYPVAPKVEITPRKPVSYELRVIIWNTEDVVLQEDDLFTGEKKSDIYVKGWLHDSTQAQNTDVHYRSLTGEGNFNWRFIFKFDYLATESKMVIKKKDSIFAREETTRKMPCILNLSVWDNDSFSADDFMGTIQLELSKMPRGASSSKLCTMEIMKPSAKNKINLFKTGRTRGWWPFLARFVKGSNLEIGGKLEAELQLVTVEEAQKNIVGEGRQGPEALPPPKRPDTSYSWFRNPLKSCKYVVCTRWRKQLCCCCFILLLVLFVALAVYALPGAVVKQMLASIF